MAPALHPHVASRTGCTLLRALNALEAVGNLLKSLLFPWLCRVTSFLGREHWLSPWSASPPPRGDRSAGGRDLTGRGSPSPPPSALSLHVLVPGRRPTRLPPDPQSWDGRAPGTEEMLRKCELNESGNRPKVPYLHWLPPS